MELRAALTQYLEMHKHLSSVHTIKQYGMHLRRFTGWLEETAGIRETEQLTLVHLRAWTGYISSVLTGGNHRKREPLGAVTVHGYCLSVKIFVRWLERDGVIDPPISYRWQIPKRPDKEPSVITPMEARTLLKVSGEHFYRYRQWAADALSARNQAIVTLFMDSGIRRSELAGLRLVDVNYAESLVMVTRKGGREQAVPVSEEAMAVLDEYLQGPRGVLARGVRALRTDAVFLTAKGSPLSANGVSSLFQQLRRLDMQTDKQISPHALRRYMATTQLALGRDSLHVQRQLGHSTLSMTNRYIALSVEQLRASHERFSPLRAAKEAKPGRPVRVYYEDEEEQKCK